MPNKYAMITCSVDHVEIDIEILRELETDGVTQGLVADAI